MVEAGAAEIPEMCGGPIEAERVTVERAETEDAVGMDATTAAIATAGTTATASAIGREIDTETAGVAAAARGATEGAASPSALA